MSKCTKRESLRLYLHRGREKGFPTVPQDKSSKKWGYNVTVSDESSMPTLLLLIFTLISS